MRIARRSNSRTTAPSPRQPLCLAVLPVQTAAAAAVSRMDMYQSITFHRAKMIGKPMAGICRGSQFLNVMAGGRLCQHLDGHGSWHDMETSDGRSFEVSSTHHQMMLPPEGAKVIGWSAK